MSATVTSQPPTFSRKRGHSPPFSPPGIQFLTLFNPPMASIDSSQSAVIPAFILIGIAAFASSAVQSTDIYLIEQYICHDRYSIYDPQIVQEGGFIDETLCKLPEIQSKVAQINGMYTFLSFLPAFILTGPWGKLTRVFGKKNVLFLNILSMGLGMTYFVAICYYRALFNIRLIWLKPLFNIIGGGQVILSSLIMTYVAESVDSKSLSAVLYRFSALYLSMVFVGLSLSSYLLRVNVWLLCGIGLSGYALMIPVTFLFPSSPCYETPLSLPRHTCHIDYASTVEFPSSETTSFLSCPSCDMPRTSPLRIVFNALKSNHRHNLELLTSLLCVSPLSRLTIIAFFLLTLVNGIEIIFTQWASVTYQWIIADVQALSSFEMIVSGTILLSLPILTARYLAPYVQSSSAVDMFVSKYSLMFWFVGLSLMIVSPTRVCYVFALTVCTLSIPLTDSLRSFSTGLIGEKEEVEKLYLGISMVETIGGMVATVVWSGLFSNVLGKGWALERTPFWGCLVIMGAVWLVLRKLGRFGLVSKTEPDGEAEPGEEGV